MVVVATQFTIVDNNNLYIVNLALSGRKRWRGAVVTHLTCNQKIPSSILGVSFHFVNSHFEVEHLLQLSQRQRKPHGKDDSTAKGERHYIFTVSKNILL